MKERTAYSCKRILEIGAISERAVKAVVSRRLGVCCCCGERDVLMPSGLCVWCAVCCTDLLFIWHGDLETERVIHSDEFLR